MKGVRMLGLTETVLVMLTKLREFEFEAYQKARSLLVWVLLISNVMCKSGLAICCTYISMLRHVSIYCSFTFICNVS